MLQYWQGLGFKKEEQLIQQCLLITLIHYSVPSSLAITSKLLFPHFKLIIMLIQEP